MSELKTIPNAAPLSPLASSGVGVTTQTAPPLASPPAASAPAEAGALKRFVSTDVLAEGDKYKQLPGYQSATPAERARIDTLMRAPGSDRWGMVSLLRSRAWIEHPEAREQILTVAEALPRDGIHLSSLAELCTEEKNGQAKIFDKSADGSTLLAQLHRLATQPMLPAASKALAPETSKTVLASIVSDCATPGNIKQGKSASCGPTSIQYVLVQRNPAEYARLTVGLVVDGECKTRGGKRLVLHPPSIEPSHDASRSASCRIFQSAVAAVFDPGRTWDHTAHRDKPSTTLLDSVPGWLRALALILFPLAIILASIRAGGISMVALDDLSESILGERYSHEGYYFSGDPDRPGPSPLMLLRRLKAQGLLGPDSGVFICVNDFGGARHFLRVEGIVAGPPESLVCRNPWGPPSMFAGAKPGDPVPGAPAGVVWDQPMLGTIRMPMDADTDEQIETVHFPQAKP